MKTEIERINAQTESTEEIQPLEKAIKKLSEDPEATHEPKGKRGRLKSTQATGAASSSTQVVKAEPDKDMDAKTSRT